MSDPLWRNPSASSFSVNINLKHLGSSAFMSTPGSNLPLKSWLPLPHSLISKYVVSMVLPSRSASVHVLTSNFASVGPDLYIPLFYAVLNCECCFYRQILNFLLVFGECFNVDLLFFDWWLVITWALFTSTAVVPGSWPIRFYWTIALPWASPSGFGVTPAHHWLVALLETLRMFAHMLGIYQELYESYHTFHSDSPDDKFFMTYIEATFEAYHGCNYISPYEVLQTENHGFSEDHLILKVNHWFCHKVPQSTCMM